MADGFENEFPILNDVIFLNHAGVSPLPARAARAMRQAIDDLEHHGPLRQREAVKRMEWLRGAAAQMLHCTADEIAFVKNTTEGLSLVAEGLDWREGDNIVTAAHEFPANIYPWRSLARRGVELRIVAERNYRFEVADFAAAMDSRTRLVTVSAVQFSTGFRMPLEALGELCRERGVLLCVDAIQALGAAALDVQRCNIAFLSADGHKWLLGPEGFGVFYCRRDCIERLPNCILGWLGVPEPSNYDRADQPWVPTARRFEEGSHNLVGAVGLAGSVELLLEIGLEQVERRILDLTRLLLEGLERRGCEIFTPREDALRLGIVAFRHPAVASDVLFRRLLERKIVGAHRRGWIRFSPHFYNRKEQIEAALAALD
ncbi:MAG: aminotransferase class V-fold PLP-dependent enzyme [Candidatus Sumerlaeia bacterium]|nr:aminotransferase class V-fold PLP-dependent enzyme [Candidatus Sumerlaeia bacterium]